MDMSLLNNVNHILSISYSVALISKFRTGWQLDLDLELTKDLS